MNKKINGIQCTVLWHVDDLKISHKQPEAVEKFIDALNQRYKKTNVKHRKNHSYLGMHISYAIVGKFTINMHKYTNEIIQQYPSFKNGQ